MLFGLGVKMDFETAQKYLKFADENNLPFSAAETGDLLIAANMGDWKKLSDRLLDFVRPLTVMDRAILAFVLNGTIKKPANRPVHPSLASFMYSLGVLLRVEQGYEKEQARVTMMSSLAGKSETGIRNLLKKAPKTWTNFWDQFETLEPEARERLRELVFEEFAKIGIEIKRF